MEREIIIIILGASPVFELRGAIPLAMLQFHFPVYKAFILAVIGNALPIIPALFFLKKLSDFLMRRWYFFNRLMTWLFEHFRRSHAAHFEKWKWSFFALIIFVAVPLPFTGAWSGVIAAHVLGLSFWKSILAIFTGIIISGIIVSILMNMSITSFNLIF